MPSRDRPSSDEVAEPAAVLDRAGVFRTLVDNSFVGHVIADADGILRYVNRHFAEACGYLPEELIGQHISVVHTPEQVAVSQAIIKSATRDGQKRPQEHWYLHRDGTTFPLLVAVVALESDDGVRHTALTAVDLAEARRAQVAYQTLFDEMLDGFAHHEIICDESGAPIDYRYLAANPAFERMTGLKVEDLVGRTVREALPGVEQRWIDTYGEVALTGEPIRFEDYAAALDKHFEVTAFRPAPGEFACIFQDITEAKRSEQALRDSESELLRTQRMAALGNWKWDSATDETVWSETLYELFGLDPTTPTPTLAQQEPLFTPASYKILLSAVASTVKTGEPYEVELEIIRNDGEVRTVWVHGERVTDAEGRPTGLWGSAQDVTERKREADERRNLEAQLATARRLEAIGTLSGGIAHDFNNMLTVILGHTERLLASAAPEDPAREDLDQIRRAAEHSANLTHQLLAFARSQPAIPKVIDLNEAVASGLTLLRRLIGEDIDLAWKPGKRRSFVKIDPSHVDQILTNLCVNSRDAISGTGTITVEVSEADFDDEYCRDHVDCVPGIYAQLAVSDNGRGMNTETLGHLFEPFFTTKELGQGTGLGLATVYGIVRQNSGFVTVYSEPDVGTTFRIYLPRHDEEPASASTDELPTTAEELGGRETILLVEDEPAILTMTAAMLEGRGYEVLAAGTPSEALAFADGHPGRIDLLLTDVTLPEMNGRELADQLRAGRPGLRCLYMSGYAATIVNGNGVLAEGAPFISKPFHLRDLAAKVRETLGG